MEFFLTKPIHISLDAMGGDYAPDIIINGAAQAKLRYPNLISKNSLKNVLIKLPSYLNLPEI